MNLDALTTFVTILDAGSLNEAAARLHVTPSTVTARLQSLEQELGQRLVHRSKSGAVATPAGERVRHNVDTIVALWDQVRRTAAMADPIIGHVAIGAEPHLWSGFGSRLVAIVDDATTGQACTVRHGSPTEIARWQADGLTDLALTHTPTLQQGFTVHEVATEALVLVGDRPDRPLSHDPGYVFVEAGDGFARDHAAAFAHADIARLTFTSPIAALDHLLTLGGSAYLPERMVIGPVADGRLHRLADAPSFRRDVFLVAPTDAESRWAWFAEALASLGGVAHS